LPESCINGDMLASSERLLTIGIRRVPISLLYWPV